jgi:transposase
MGEKDIVRMTGKDLKRLKVIGEVLEGRMSQREAAGVVGLSQRQIRRLVRRVRAEGEVGVVHRSRGRPSNRRISGQLRERVLGLYRERYVDFGPTLANEKLFELEGIKISTETLRKWLIGEHLWKRRRKRSQYRRWRQRRACCGQMVQMDGSHHDWLEGRGPQLVLMGYIDDATSTVFARFYDYEGTFPALDSFRRYIERYGLPQSVYVDKHSTYKSPRKLTVQEQLAGLEEPKSQFERALEELVVEVIHAHSPQAKGRIERLFGTFQDRLVKEMRLRGISTRGQANRFLARYLPGYNRRFRVQPEQSADLHRQIPRGTDLDSILSVREKRTVRRDFTVAHNNGLYQIEEPPAGVSMNSVVVEQRLDGSIHIISNGRELKYKKIHIRPPRPKEQKSPGRKKRYNPPPDHPWRKLSIVSSGKINEPVC